MDKKLTLLEHIEELRARILKSAVFLIVISCLVYAYVDTILSVLVKPVGKLVFIAPQEAFTSKVAIAFLGGLFLSAPFMLYQIWRFISSALKTDEKRYTLIFAPLSLIFFIAGSIFGYIIIVPIGMKFLLGFATDFLTPAITISKYVSFIGTLTLAFGIVFELPLISLFLTKIGVITPVFLSNKRRHAIVLIFIIAAMLTPPDVITQVLMAVPLLVLYEVGIIFSRLAYRRRK